MATKSGLSKSRIIYRLRGGPSTDRAKWVLDIDATEAPIVGRYLHMSRKSLNEGWWCRYVMTDEHRDDDPLYDRASITFFDFVDATPMTTES
jgi:hypothetical protein